jgi:hypothetical protein
MGGPLSEGQARGKGLAILPVAGDGEVAEAVRQLTEGKWCAIPSTTNPSGWRSPSPSLRDGEDHSRLSPS